MRHITEINAIRDVQLCYHLLQVKPMPVHCVAREIKHVPGNITSVITLREDNIEAISIQTYARELGIIMSSS